MTSTEQTQHHRKNGKHPLLIGREPGVWHRDLVGLVPGYAATEDGYRRRQEAARAQARSMNDKGQRGCRKGVPDGYAGRRADVEEIKEETRRAAREAVGVLLDRGAVDDAAKGPTDIEEEFAKAMDPTGNQRARLKALKRVLQLVKV